jgi:hypothetical protein
LDSQIFSKEMFRKFAYTFSRFTNFLVNFGIDTISIPLTFRKGPTEQPIVRGSIPAQVGSKEIGRPGFHSRHHFNGGEIGRRFQVVLDLPCAYRVCNEAKRK